MAIKSGIAAVIVATFLATDLSACGDKFLLLGRSVGYKDLLRAQRPGTILIYTGADSDQNPLQHPRFAALLDLAGHRYRTVRNPQMLGQAMTERKFDLVLADQSETRQLAQYLGTNSEAVLVPVLAGGTKADAKAIERQYGCVIRFAAKAQARDIVDALDKAMKLRLRRLPTRKA
jgi:hypothetical protein